MKLSLQHPSLSLIAFLVVLATLTACGKSSARLEDFSAKSALSHSTDSGIAWREGDVENAFLEAQESRKPVLLYWGAAWCPPCNRLKATLFKDPDFIKGTREFVAVHLDGDASGTQAWADRFGVIGYPTIILLRPDRSEITRLTGDADNKHLTEALHVAAKSGATFKQLLDKALQTPNELSPDGWALLKTYAWNADDQMVEAGDTADVLGKLSKAAPEPALQRHFAIAALAERSDLPPADPIYRDLLEKLLANPAEVRANVNVLPFAAARLVALASKDTDDRAALSGRMNAALDEAYADTTLPLVDRLGITKARIGLARLAQGESFEGTLEDPQPLPADLINTVRRRVKWAIDATKTDEERQAVVDSATFLLSEIGDSSSAEQLLLSELGRSKAPYFYMDYLAKLAERRGDSEAALSWFRKAYETSEGLGTRVRLGVSYINAMLRLSPYDAKGIEAKTIQVLSELAGEPGWYEHSNRKRLEKLGASLQAWSKRHPGKSKAVLERVRNKMEAICESDDKADCTSWLG